MDKAPKKPFRSIKEAGNFVDKVIKKQDPKLFKPLPTILTPQTRMKIYNERRDLLIGQLKVLKNKTYRMVLEARIRGASHEMIANSMKERVSVVKDIERAALGTLQNELDKTQRFEKVMDKKWDKNQEEDISTG